MAKNKEVQVKFSVFNKEYNKAMKEMRDETSRLTKEFQLEQEQLKNTGSETEKLTSKLEYLNKSHEQAQKSVKATEEQLNKTKELYGENSKEVSILENKLINTKIAEQKFANQIFDTNKKLVEEESKLNEVEEALKETASATSKLEDSLGEASDSTGKFNKSLEETSENIGEIGDKSSNAGESLSKGLTAPIVAIGVAGIASSENINNALSAIDNKLGQQGELDFYKESLEQIGSTGVGSFEEIAEAIVNIEQNMEGVSNESFNVVTEQAMQLAKVMGYDVTEVTRSAGTLMKQFGIDGESALDLISVGFQNGLDFSGEFLDTINEYSVQFKALGFSADDMFNTLITGAEAGAFNLDKVGDAVKEFNIRSKDGSDTTSKAFQSLGLNASELSATFSKGGDSAKLAFSEVVSALSKVGDEQQKNAIGVALFGTQYEDLEADVVAAMGSINNELGNYSNAAEDIAEKNKDLSQILKGAWNDIQVAIKPVGDRLKDLLMTVLPPLLDFIKWLGETFSNLSPTMQNIILVILGLIAAIGPLLLIIGGIASSITSITSLFTMFSGAAATGGVATAGFGASLLGVIGPILGVVAVIAVVIAIVVVLYKNWDAIKAKTLEVWNAIKEYIATVVENIKTSVQNMKDAISSKVSDIKSSIVNGFNSALAFIAELPSTMLDYGKNIIDGLVNGIKSKINAVKDAVSGIGNAVKDKITGVLGIHSPSRVMAEIGGYTGEGFILGIKDKIQEVKRVSQLVADVTTNNLKDIPNESSDYLANSTTNSYSNQVIVNATVREEADIRKITEKVAYELEGKQENSRRAKGRR